MSRIERFRFKFLMISITQFCQICSNMKMSNNPAKYEILIKQCLRSILDMSDAFMSNSISILLASLVVFDFVNLKRVFKQRFF